MGAFDVAIRVLLFAVLIGAATTDIVSRKVPHWITLPPIAFGLALSWAAGEWTQLEASLLGLAIAVGVFGAAYLVGGVGGGDLKLVAAIGAIMGAPFIVNAIFWSSLVGMIMAVSLLVWRGRLGTGLKRAVRYALSIKREEPLPEGDPAAARIPYGVAIAFGTLFAFFLTEGLA